MKIEMQPGRHYVAHQTNGATKDGSPVVLEFAGEGAAASAHREFWGRVSDRQCNWVKFWTIRELDKAYLFNGEFQKRTPR